LLTLVSARDSGPEAVSADAAVIVRVGDVNDNPPRISVNTLLASHSDAFQLRTTRKLDRSTG